MNRDPDLYLFLKLFSDIFFSSGAITSFFPSGVQCETEREKKEGCSAFPCSRCLAIEADRFEYTYTYVMPMGSVRLYSTCSLSTNCARGCVESVVPLLELPAVNVAIGTRDRLIDDVSSNTGRTK